MLGHVFVDSLLRLHRFLVHALEGFREGSAIGQALHRVRRILCGHGDAEHFTDLLVEPCELRHVNSSSLDG